MPSLRRHDARQIDDFMDVSGGMLVVQAATMLSLGTKSGFRERTVLDMAKLSKFQVKKESKSCTSLENIDRNSQVEK